ncbi:DgyrCDS1386 [Dimorphilus gyrociliatus]|uniref:Peroxisomal biogenesis factor 3 n=1 Tax=Dimorphilus gyrociliatus TaxID=2664684 RepID=A0A7I8V792_9ANNE|nr:DgyrCDS1386 [Dimorphilus gyrociliatus]
MFGSIWNFCKRHRRKFFFTGILVGGSYAAFRFVYSKYMKSRKEESEKMMEKVRKKHLFESNQKTCDLTVHSLIPTLRNVLNNILDCEGILEKLKSKTDNKVALWEELKVKTFTRTISSIYATSLLIVYLKVQLNIVSGLMFTEIEKTNEEGKRITNDVQKKYLSTINYLLEHGIEGLIQKINIAVNEYISGISLKANIAINSIEELTRQIRHRVECQQTDGHHETSTKSLLSYILNSNQLEANGELKELLNFTKDVTESSDFHKVLSVCLESGFALFYDNVANELKEANPSTVSLANSSLPMAKVVPIITNFYGKVMKEGQNNYIQMLLRKNVLQDFAANIYEAFSSNTEMRAD